jgi:hypothetical protein
MGRGFRYRVPEKADPEGIWRTLFGDIDARCYYHACIGGPRFRRPKSPIFAVISSLRGRAQARCASAYTFSRLTGRSGGAPNLSRTARSRVSGTV